MTNLFPPFACALAFLSGARPGFPADVAPPVPFLLGGAAVALVVIGVVVLVIVLVSIRVLRRIRQENTNDQEQ
jgi:hypothetical protein